MYWLSLWIEYSPYTALVLILLLQLREIVNSKPKYYSWKSYSQSMHRAKDNYEWQEDWFRVYYGSQLIGTCKAWGKGYETTMDGVENIILEHKRMRGLVE